MSKINAVIETARPHQYLKNGLIWLPLFFGHKLHDKVALLFTFYAFLSFCLMASSVYILNDLKDMDVDRNHPTKRFRPLPSGKLDKTTAMVAFFICIISSFFLSISFLPKECTIILGSYLALNISYTLILKHYAIIDVICIATGFVLRVFAGGFAADVKNSHFIIIMTFLMALFIALAKRRDDILLAESGLNTRKNIDGYNLEFISLGMGIMASVIIVSYILYTVSPDIIVKHGTDALYLTAFWVIAGLLRYLQITFVEEKSGSPTLILIKDLFLKAVVIMWILNFYIVLYRIN